MSHPDSDPHFKTLDQSWAPGEGGQLLPASPKSGELKLHHRI